MSDKLLEMVFEKDRWENAIQHGVDKNIPIPWLRSMCDEYHRCIICKKIVDGTYRISAPHTALIPKDTPGDFRTVYINEPVDRVLLNVVNECLCEMGSDMVHKSCKSYQRGLSCGDTVIDISRKIAPCKGVVGWKSDYSKYFDSVKIEAIDEAFDTFERRHGKSCIIDLLRKYYHDDTYLEWNEDTKEWQVLHKYQSLKQGCAVASWLANAIMYEQDERISNLGGTWSYARYSDDTWYVGASPKEAFKIMQEVAEKKGVTINPKKVEDITRDKWVKFLGFSVKGEKRSLSANALGKLTAEIKRATIKNKNCNTAEKAMRAIYRILYKGPRSNQYSWALRYLRVINEEADICRLDSWFKDIIRACHFNRRKVGGLGYRKEQSVGCLHRGTGANINSNYERMPEIEGYITLKCMQDNLLTCRGEYDLIVRTMM